MTTAAGGCSYLENYHINISTSARAGESDLIAVGKRNAGVRRRSCGRSGVWTSASGFGAPTSNVRFPLRHARFLNLKFLDRISRRSCTGILGSPVRFTSPRPVPPI
jgi:hypothetical protein